MASRNTVLVVGATGYLGGQATRTAVERGMAVRALVRPGSDSSKLRQLGVEIVEGDLLDRASLERAMPAGGAVIHTAIGYSNRRKGDSGGGTDTVGTQNLAAAARAAGVRRVVFCSVLTCDSAQSVPHFWNKKLSEDCLEKAEVPFVALRPGAFLDQADDFWAAGLRKGKLLFMVPADVKLTFVHSADVADLLVRAVNVELPSNSMRVDIGADRALSIDDVAQIMSRQLGRVIRPQIPPWPVLRAGLTLAGMFDPWQRDLKHMVEYFRTGAYVADTRLQATFFGQVPRIEDSIGSYLEKIGLQSGSPRAAAERQKEQSRTGGEIDR